MKLTFEKGVGIRLNQFILIQTVSQTSFAQTISVSRGYLNDVLKGRKGIGADALINIAKAYKNLNMRWLLTGEGEMFELEKIYDVPPPELASGVSEGIKIEYPKPEGELERLKRLVNEHEQRLRDLENKE